MVRTKRKVGRKPGLRTALIVYLKQLRLRALYTPGNLGIDIAELDALLARARRELATERRRIRRKKARLGVSQPGSEDSET